MNEQEKYILQITEWNVEKMKKTFDILKWGSDNLMNREELIECMDNLIRENFEDNSFYENLVEIMNAIKNGNENTIYYFDQYYEFVYVDTFNNVNDIIKWYEEE